eukprot:5330628-Amphidinium_carterae.1
MNVASNTAPEDIRNTTGERPEVLARSRRLYHMHATSVAGKALLRVCAADRGNGYEAWSRLKLEYEPRQGARRTAFLIGPLNPSWGPLVFTGVQRSLCSLGSADLQIRTKLWSITT